MCGLLYIVHWFRKRTYEDILEFIQEDLQCSRGTEGEGGGIEGNPPSDIEQDCFTYFLCRCYKMLKFFSARDDENESLLGALTDGKVFNSIV